MSKENIQISWGNELHHRILDSFWLEVRLYKANNYFSCPKDISNKNVQLSPLMTALKMVYYHLMKKYWNEKQRCVEKLHIILTSQAWVWAWLTEKQISMLRNVYAKKETSNHILPLIAAIQRAFVNLHNCKSQFIAKKCDRYSCKQCRYSLSLRHVPWIKGKWFGFHNYLYFWPLCPAVPDLFIFF